MPGDPGLAHIKDLHKVLNGKIPLAQDAQESQAGAVCQSFK
jgi:hypothetical protein